MARIFRDGDKVFAKMRGHPAWPARVESIADSSPSNRKYHVLFYGTMQRGICRSNEIFSFTENKEKYGKVIKRKGFKEALDQIEGVSPVPELVPKIVDGNYRNGFSKVVINNTQIIVNNNNAVNDVDSTVDKKRRVVKRNETKIFQEVHSLKKSFQLNDVGDLPVQEQRNLLREDTRNQNTLEVNIRPLIDSDPHETCTSRVTKREKKPVLKANPKSWKKIVRSKQSTLKSCSHSIHHVSECQIQNDAFCKKSAPLYSSYSNKSLGKQLSTSVSGTISRSGRVIKRKSFHDESEISVPVQKRISVRNEKHNTQSSTKLNLPRRQKLTKEVVTSQKDAALRKQTVRNWLATENCLTKLDTLVRSQLSVSRANPEQCIQYLDDLKKLDLKPLMLKKHPEVVETIKRLRKYVGNPNAWNFSEEQRREFEEKATCIREKAEAIFEKFKSMFCTRDSITFLKVFADNVIAFQAKTQNWPLEKVYALTSEPEVKQKPAKPEKTRKPRN